MNINKHLVTTWNWTMADCLHVLMVIGYQCGFFQQIVWWCYSRCGKVLIQGPGRRLGIPYFAAQCLRTLLWTAWLAAGSRAYCFLKVLLLLSRRTFPTRVSTNQWSCSLHMHVFPDSYSDKLIHACAWRGDVSSRHFRRIETTEGISDLDPWSLTPKT